MSSVREGKALVDPATETTFVMESLTQLQSKLSKKQTFESAVAALSDMVLDLYSSASPSDQTLMYSTVCRAGTLLKTRYTGIGFWMAGLQLFEAALKVVTKKEEKENVKSLVKKAREIIEASQENVPMARSGRTGGFLFEGQLTVDQEPPLPRWLADPNAFAAAATASEQLQRNVNDGQTLVPQLNELLTADMRELMQRVNDLSEIDAELEHVIQATFQELGNVPHGTPPASKEEIAKLTVKDVNESLLKQLPEEVECAVCKEQLVVGDKMQEMPCKHMFHPECLKPWLDEHNSCPICRFELRTNDHNYESKKERDKEVEEERKGAQNALPGGEFMYI